MKPLLTKLARLALVLLIGAGLFAVGRWSADPPTEFAATPPSAGAEEVWTCPMHAQIRMPEFGGCPLCGMDLVLLGAAADEGPRELAMSEAALALAGIEVQPVQRRAATRSVRMVGKVVLDQTAVRTISAWIPGRLERLYVDSTGVRIEGGEHLLDLYSPELLSAQEELLTARERIANTADESSRFLADSNQRAYRAARDKLLLWGLTEEQVLAIEERGTPEDRSMLTSPISGTVIERMLDQGDYVDVGTPLFRIADLSRVWIELDAYEQDLHWLRYGQEVVLQAEALPGEEFLGRVRLVEPLLHEHTRTTKLRVHIDNEDGRLKPGMFVRAVARVSLAADGAVLSDDMSELWVCPMHLEVVKSGAGACDVCEMPLVPATELGLTTATSQDARAPLVVPRSAVLLTGRRAVVYVQRLDSERPTFAGREVLLGPRAGDDYVVLEGLEEGELVVVNGAFRIDSSMQIKAKPSMMSAAPERLLPAGPEARLHRVELDVVLSLYLDLQAALAADDEAQALLSSRELERAVPELLAGALFQARGRELEGASALLGQALVELRSGFGLEALRGGHELLSEALLSLVERVGHEGPQLVSAWCPMAFDNEGAGWLQSGEELANPYFGASMLRCGQVLARLDPVRAPTPAEPARGAVPALEPAEADSLPDALAPAEELPEEAAPDEPAPTGGFAGIIQAYLQAQRALAGDVPQRAAAALDEMEQALQLARSGAVGDGEQGALLASMATELELLGADASIDRLRAAFDVLSTSLDALLRLAGNPLGDSLRWMHCPMAFEGRGAHWFQLEERLANPYYGAAMLRCGLELRLVDPR